jgi:Holliday junction resolvasome RuvABC endonuclease subunit
VIDATGALTRSETLRSPETKASRIAWLRDRIVAIAKEEKPDLIACEFFGVAAGARQRANAIEVVWLHGNVHVALVMSGFAAPFFVAPATLKKWYTGRGNKVEKQEIIDALSALYGVHVAEHNAADAACVGYMLHERARRDAGLGPLRRGEREFSKYEIEKMESWERAFA